MLPTPCFSLVCGARPATATEIADRSASPSLAYAQANRVGCAFRPVRSADRAYHRDQNLVISTGDARIACHDAKCSRGGRTRIALLAFRARHPRRPRIAFLAFRTCFSLVCGARATATEIADRSASPSLAYAQANRVGCAFRPVRSADRAYHR